MDVRVASDWQAFLSPIIKQDKFEKIASRLQSLKNQEREFYPKESEIFAAFNLCRLNDLKVIIIGQDPYHGLGQAHGLCFSVNEKMQLPPSLKNIYKELVQDTDCAFPQHGNLTTWAKQGVLLLNSVLTVFPDQAGSHEHLGWQWFTDEVIKKIAKEKKHVVFILWGKYAQQKETLITTGNHLILKSVHPSPLSAYRGFYGNHHFSKTNAYLVEHQKEVVDWSIK